MENSGKGMFEQGYLLLMESNGRVYTPIRVMVEVIGLDWEEEFTKLKNNPLFADGLCKLTVDDGSKVYKALGLASPHLFAWLMRYDPDDYEGESNGSWLICRKQLSKPWAGSSVEIGISLPHPGLIWSGAVNIEKGIQKMETNHE
jgi:hypothetical protein